VLAHGVHLVLVASLDLHLLGDFDLHTTTVHHLGLIEVVDESLIEIRLLGRIASGLAKDELDGLGTLLALEEDAGSLLGSSHRGSGLISTTSYTQLRALNSESTIGHFILIGRDFSSGKYNNEFSRLGRD